MADTIATSSDGKCTVSHSTFLGGIVHVEIRERLLSNEEALNLLKTLCAVLMRADIITDYEYTVAQLEESKDAEN